MEQRCGIYRPADGKPRVGRGSLLLIPARLRELDVQRWPARTLSELLATVHGERASFVQRAQRSPAPVLRRLPADTRSWLSLDRASSVAELVS
ncbi:MAG: hypothetical protein J7453_05910 [Thermomicrobium sp.]|nr:hypothetical protein [Thermomicrobium sp.]